MATRKPKAVEAETLPAATSAPAKKPRATKAKAETPVIAATEAPAAKRAKKPTAEPVAAALPALTPEERYRQVAEAAYYIAEKRGFAPGNPSDDWYQAEAEVDGKTA